MKKLTLMAVMVFMSIAAMGQTPTPTPLIAAERVYTVTEYQEAKAEVDKWKSEYNALLVVCQQQRAERELIVSAILQAVTAGDYQRVAEIVRQITVASLVSVGNGGGQK